jgi:NADH:ubiquinone reductase (H+-translocating)
MLGRFKLSGFPAWLMWLFAHLYFLIGFRNRLVVMIDWASAYFSFNRNARIVADRISDRPDQ